MPYAASWGQRFVAMGRQDTIDPTDIQKILEQLGLLLQRVERLEKYLGIPYQPGQIAPLQADTEERGTRLELNIGEYGLAWAGSIILFLGIIFLTLYTYRQGHILAANSLAYATAGILFFMSRLWRKSIPHLSRLMAAGTTVLLFYSTTRLHFVTETPVIGNAFAVVALLIPIVLFQFYLALSYDFAPFAVLAVLLGMITALLADQLIFTFVLVSVVLGTAVFLAIRRSWSLVPLVAVFLAYGTHLLWLFNNPFAGHPIQISGNRDSSIPFLFLCTAIYSVPLIFNKKALVTHPLTIVTLIMNCFLFSALTGLEAFTYSPARVPLITLLAAGLLVACSVLQWHRTRFQLPAAVFATFGFMDLSISIASHESFPQAFVWLALQSLLVLSMSLWFRSKVLVVVNSVIYSGILLTYLVISPVSHLANFTFAIVALISARILNWQKERLTLQTGILRNVYLGIAFVLILYGLYRAVPAQYVTLSWTAAAACYFFLSYLLNNVKYRWMGTLAVIVTVVYLLVVDLPRLHMTYRIIAFLFLGVIALLISLFYTRIRHLLSTRHSP